MKTIPRPNYVTDEMLKYLDNLRTGGNINMFEAAPKVERYYGLLASEARQVLQYWMQTYSARHPK